MLNKKFLTKSCFISVSNDRIYFYFQMIALILEILWWQFIFTNSMVYSSVTAKGSKWFSRLLNFCLLRTSLRNTFGSYFILIIHRNIFQFIEIKHFNLMLLETKMLYLSWVCNAKHSDYILSSYHMMRSFQRWFIPCKVLWE